MEFEQGIQSIAWHPDGKRLAIGFYRRSEVEVWDIEAKKPLFAVPSKRTLIGTSGQEALFSPDGKYLVVKDFFDTKNGSPPWPQKDDETELQAQQDRGRYRLARVWDVESQKEIAQIMGPGARTYSDQLDGMCWVGGSDKLRLAILKNTSVFMYEPVTGQLLDEVRLRYPFKEYPLVSRAYSMMDCHPKQPFIALKGGVWAGRVGDQYPEKYGLTPIVIADVNQKTVSLVLDSPVPLNGVIYTADGSKLVAFGSPPMRVWDVASNYHSIGVIEQKGGAEYLAPLPGFNGVVGMAHGLLIWDATSLQTLWRAPAPTSIFRIRAHGPSQTIAVASGSSVHFYRYHLNIIRNINTQ